jgi:hypothetical protein
MLNPITHIIFKYCHLMVSVHGVRIGNWIYWTQSSDLQIPAQFRYMHYRFTPFGAGSDA